MMLPTALATRRDIAWTLTRLDRFVQGGVAYRSDPQLDAPKLRSTAGRGRMR